MKDVLPKSLIPQSHEIMTGWTQQKQPSPVIPIIAFLLCYLLWTCESANYTHYSQGK